VSSGPRPAAVSFLGLGRVQRACLRAFVANPGAELTTADLARWAYPRLAGRPLHKHRVAIVRAAVRIAVRVRRDWPGGVVFRAFGANSGANGRLAIIIDCSTNDLGQDGNRF
jgi:hypothetical protein